MLPLHRHRRWRRDRGKGGHRWSGQRSAGRAQHGAHFVGPADTGLGPWNGVTLTIVASPPCKVCSRCSEREGPDRRRLLRQQGTPRQSRAAGRKRACERPDSRALRRNTSGLARDRVRPVLGRAPIVTARPIRIRMTIPRASHRSPPPTIELKFTGAVPNRVTRDGHDAYPRAIRTELGKTVTHRTNTYLNNRLEQDRRGIKGRIRCIHGFESVASDDRFCRGHDELRNFLRVRSLHRQHVAADRRRLRQLVGLPQRLRFFRLLERSLATMSWLY
jgi:hypothetical protein